MKYRKQFCRRFAACAGMMLLAAATGALPAAAANQADAQTIRDNIEIMVSQINDARVQEGLQEVYIVPQLNGYAQVRADEISGLFTHDRPDGTTCFTVIKNDGFFYNIAAENIAAGNETASATFEQFMNSQRHRKNILTPDMTHIGIGYCFDPEIVCQPDDYVYEHYWSMFLVGVYDADANPVAQEGQYIPVREKGDADGTKKIDAADAARILTYSAQNSAGDTPRTTQQFRDAADVNGDGWINALDAHIVLTYASEKGANPDAALEDFLWG